MNRGRGFSLIEILVVLAIIGILAAVVQFSFTGADSRQKLAAAAEHLASQVELARAEAMQSHHEFGIRLEDGGVGFLEYDPETARWVMHQDGPLKLRKLPSGVRLELKTEGFDTEALESWLDEDQDDSDSDNKTNNRESSASASQNRKAAKDQERDRLVPQVLLLSSGETTPFSIQLIPESEDVPWMVRSDGLSRTTATLVDEGDV